MPEGFVDDRGLRVGDAIVDRRTVGPGEVVYATDFRRVLPSGGAEWRASKVWCWRGGKWPPRAPVGDL